MKTTSEKNKAKDLEREKTENKLKINDEQKNTKLNKKRK